MHQMHVREIVPKDETPDEHDEEAADGGSKGDDACSSREQDSKHDGRESVSETIRDVATNQDKGHTRKQTDGAQQSKLRSVDLECLTQHETRPLPAKGHRFKPGECSLPEQMSNLKRSRAQMRAERCKTGPRSKPRRADDMDSRRYSWRDCTLSSSGSAGWNRHPGHPVDQSLG